MKNIKLVPLFIAILSSFVFNSCYRHIDVNGRPVCEDKSNFRLCDSSHIYKNIFKLEWLFTDPDGDSMIYDVYCDTNNPPDLYKSDIKTSYIELEPISNIPLTSLNLESGAESQNWEFTIKYSK